MSAFEEYWGTQPGSKGYRPHLEEAARAAWNAAVEACAEKAEEQKFRGVPTIAREIRKLKAGENES